MRFNVLAALKLSIQICWDMTLCNRHVKGTKCLQLQLLDIEDEGNTYIQNITNHKANDTTSHSLTPEFLKFMNRE